VGTPLKAGGCRLLRDLTSREKEVVELAVKGYTNKEIASFLEITSDGVKKHLRNIYSKLKVSGKTELASLVSNNFPVMTIKKDHKDVLSGFWVSCFSCYLPDNKEGSQLEVIQVWQSGGIYLGRNILAFGERFNFMYDLKLETHDRYIIGRWTGKNMFCVGSMTLKLSDWNHTATGSYLASADHLQDKKEVYSGDWHWVKLDITEEEVKRLERTDNASITQKLLAFLKARFLDCHANDQVLTVPDEIRSSI
jgi:DNA-binding CsgD family transcriptional regulator